MADLPLYVLGGLFAVWEGYAHFVSRNRRQHTASYVVRHWEGESLVRKAVVSWALLVLFAHLVLELF